MAEDWRRGAAAKYNQHSLDCRDDYPAILMMPIDTLSTILEWTFQSLPDEILVGMDPDYNTPHPSGVDDMFCGSDHSEGLFAGQGFVLGPPHLVNRGDSYSVHHVPEEWVDGVLSEDRGVRGGRFTHWIHTHPNAVAIPSGADAEAAQWTEGCDMILGVRYSPEGVLPWFDDVEGARRRLTPEEVVEQGDSDSPYLGRSVTGHRIHGLEIIAFHRTGLGVNLILTDREGRPILTDP